ncbi:LuxR C-terminal-related transcriptional regulator [Nocardia takedensis]|uniref:LuxR C-terminal-related transcriptional regulator n=1 Tax=Nocardia takedensis TaxID=259390 RepID=UPI003F770E96
MTSREVEVLVLLGGGYTKPEIAEKLGLKASTVRYHLDMASARLGVTGAMQAVVTAVRRGLISPGDGLIVVPAAAWDDARMLAIGLLDSDNDLAALRRYAQRLLSCADGQRRSGSADPHL